MQAIDLRQLTEQIKQVFLEQDTYVFGKLVTEFERNGTFGGDFVNFAMIDPSTTPPTFYEVSTPFDLISKKASQHALVYRDGVCILQTDFTEYAGGRYGRTS